MSRHQPRQWTNERMNKWTNALRHWAIDHSLNIEHLSHWFIAPTRGRI